MTRYVHVLIFLFALAKSVLLVGGFAVVQGGDHHGVVVSRATTTTTTTALASSTKDAETKSIAAADNDEVEEKENPRLAGLALQLDDGTRKSHSMAQNSAFVTGFFKGLSNKESYRNLITSLYFVYQAMEESFDDTTCTEVQALDDSELRRMKCLEEDMDYFYGREWKSEIRPTLATKAYVTRIQTLAKQQPYLLVAHQYTRYLGDLFGGQMMGGMASRSLDLKDGEGTAFYTFDDIPSTYEYITDWYTRLNALDLTDAQKQEIVDEANLVFDLNIGILQELDGSPFLAMWTLAVNSLKVRLGLAK
jgi:heme oxygenase